MFRRETLEIYSPFYTPEILSQRIAVSKKKKKTNSFKCVHYNMLVFLL